MYHTCLHHTHILRHTYTHAHTRTHTHTYTHLHTHPHTHTHTPTHTHTHTHTHLHRCGLALVYSGEVEGISQWCKTASPRTISGPRRVVMWLAMSNRESDYFRIGTDVKPTCDSTISE